LLTIASIIRLLSNRLSPVEWIANRTMTEPHNQATWVRNTDTLSRPVVVIAVTILASYLVQITAAYSPSPLGRNGFGSLSSHHFSQVAFMSSQHGRALTVSSSEHEQDEEWDDTETLPAWFHWSHPDEKRHLYATEFAFLRKDPTATMPELEYLVSEVVPCYSLKRQFFNEITDEDEDSDLWAELINGVSHEHIDGNEEAVVARLACTLA